MVQCVCNCCMLCLHVSEMANAEYLEQSWCANMCWKDSKARTRVEGRGDVLTIFVCQTHFSFRSFNSTNTQKQQTKKRQQQCEFQVHVWDGMRGTREESARIERQVRFVTRGRGRPCDTASGRDPPLWWRESPNPPCTNDSRTSRWAKESSPRGAGFLSTRY